MASSGSYVVKVSGKRDASDEPGGLYLDLGRLILAAEAGHDLAIVLEGGERVLLSGDDAAWVREILEAMAQPRKSGHGQVFVGGRR